jgi:hypothetical protein
MLPVKGDRKNRPLCHATEKEASTTALLTDGSDKRALQTLHIQAERRLATSFR